MVKIKRSPSKKRYMRKRVYEYFKLHLPIPSRFFEKLEPYFKEDFQAEMTEDETKIALTYTHYKKTKKAWTPTATHFSSSFSVFRDNKADRQNVSEPRKHLVKTQGKIQQKLKFTLIFNIKPSIMAT